MKLEVGKKYVTRDQCHYMWIRVDYIRPETDLGSHRVAVTAADLDSGKATAGLNYSIGGRYLETEKHGLDLVAEYKEPELCLGPEHVGMRVRLRDGSISLLCDFADFFDSQTPGIVANTARYSYYINGQSFVDREKDIVEILP